jgi:predicted phage terminase large subunit-like protein
VLAAQGQAPAAHHLAVISALEEVERGRTERLMLLLPPGSAKSTYASLLFPAWWLARHPQGSIITACHTAGLAQQFGRSVRGLVSEHAARLGVTLCRDARAAGRFATRAGGAFYAIGVNGAVTGQRADLALIDDPIRSFAEAENGRARERLWNWYRSELVTRLKPRGRIVLVMTRWHRDDLAARLMAQDGWRVLQLPALAEDGDFLGRRAGEALWPEWEGREALLAKQAAMGERAFAALFQQAPLASDGCVFDTTQLGVADDVPDGEVVRAWDLAGSAGGDWTVGVKLRRDAAGGCWVDDVRRFRAAPDGVAEAVCATARQDGADVTIGLPRDPGQAGQFQVMMLTRALAGFRVVATPEVGSKVRRARAVASQVSGGGMKLRRAAWNTAFIEELAAFPDGPKDDQVDALSRAFGMLAAVEQPARFAVIPFFSR